MTHPLLSDEQLRALLEQSGSVSFNENMQAAARLGAQIERERCAKVCEEVYKPGDWFDGVTICRHCAAAIRSQP